MLVLVTITCRQTVAEAGRGKPGGGTGCHCDEACPGYCRERKSEVDWKGLLVSRSVQ